MSNIIATSAQANEKGAVARLGVHGNGSELALVIALLKSAEGRAVECHGVQM